MRSVIASAYPKEGTTTVCEFGRTLLSCGPDDMGRHGATVVAPPPGAPDDDAGEGEGEGKGKREASGSGRAGADLPACAWHAHRRWVAACDPDGVTVHIYSAEERPLEARARALAGSRSRGQGAAAAGLPPFELPREPLATLVSPHHARAGVRALCWSPTGCAVLAVGCAGGVCLWRLSGVADAAAAASTAALPSPTRESSGAPTSSAAVDGVVARCTWLPHPSAGYRDEYRCVAALSFTPDGRELAAVSGGMDDLVVVWDVARGTGTRMRRSGATWPIAGVLAMQLLLFAPRLGLLAGHLGLVPYVLLILALEVAHALYPSLAVALPYAPARRVWEAFKEGVDHGGSAMFVAMTPFRDRGGSEATGSATASFSPCGKYLVTATGADRGHFRIWETTSWASRLWEVPHSAGEGEAKGKGATDGALTAVCWGPGGASLALAFSHVPGLVYMLLIEPGPGDPPVPTFMTMKARSDGTLGVVDATTGLTTPSPCRLVAWDPDTGRLAAAFYALADGDESTADLVALFETGPHASSTLLDLRLLGHVRGPPGSGAPVGLAFPPHRRGAVGTRGTPHLGVTWSSGHVTLFPMYL